MYGALTAPTGEEEADVNAEGDNVDGGDVDGGDVDGRDGDVNGDGDQEAAWEEDPSDDADSPAGLGWDLDPVRGDGEPGADASEEGGWVREVQTPEGCSAAGSPKPGAPSWLALWAAGVLGVVAARRRRRG